MYYNMRAKTISRNLTTLKKCLLNEVKTVLELPLSKLKTINFKIKSVSCLNFVLKNQFWNQLNSNFSCNNNMIKKTPIFLTNFFLYAFIFLKPNYYFQKLILLIC